MPLRHQLMATLALTSTVVCLAEPGKPAGDGRGTRYLQENGWWTPDPRLLLGPYEEELPASNTNAVFVTANNTMTTVQAGANALLRCRITDLADHETVSWIRRRDHHIITVGTHTYSNDDRFSVSFNHHTQDWTLQLKYAQMRDAGMYECQVSSHPPTSILTTLFVVQAVSVISGGPEVYAQHGSDVTLKCRMRNFTEPPTYVFWYHNSHMVNYDDEQRVSVLSRGGESTLRLRRVGQTDSGNYTCLPANAKPSSVLLHVIREEAPAAMQRARATTPTDGLHAFLASLTLLLLAS